MNNQNQKNNHTSHFNPINKQVNSYKMPLYGNNQTKTNYSEVPAIVIKKISVIIPAYNEEKRIRQTLLSVNNFLAKQTLAYEIIVVNDGSRDNTKQVVLDLMPQIANLSLIDNLHNYGKGWVTKEGMLHCSGDIRIFMDADNSTKIEEINKMLPYFYKGFQIVVGSRRISGSHVAISQGALRDFLGAVFRLIVHTIVPVNIRDTQCGFKAFTARAAKEVFKRQTIFRWAFDVEILAIARKLNFNIKEVPITWFNDSESHVKFMGEVLMLVEILKTRLNLWMGKYR